MADLYRERNRLFDESKVKRIRLLKIAPGSGTRDGQVAYLEVMGVSQRFLRIVTKTNVDQMDRRAKRQIKKVKNIEKTMGTSGASRSRLAHLRQMREFLAVVSNVL